MVVCCYVITRPLAAHRLVINSPIITMNLYFHPHHDKILQSCKVSLINFHHDGCLWITHAPIFSFRVIHDFNNTFATQALG